jgi:hypothetical protein
MVQSVMCSICGKPSKDGFLECMGVVVCRECAGDDVDFGEGLLAVTLRERGFVDKDGKMTEKAKSLDADRLYDHEGNIKPWGWCDS